MSKQMKILFLGLVAALYIALCVTQQVEAQRRPSAVARRSQANAESTDESSLAVDEPVPVVPVRRQRQPVRRADLDDEEPVEADIIEEAPRRRLAPRRRYRQRPRANNLNFNTPDGFPSAAFGGGFGAAFGGNGRGPSNAAGFGAGFAQAARGGSLAGGFGGGQTSSGSSRNYEDDDDDYEAPRTYNSTNCRKHQQNLQKAKRVQGVTGDTNESKTSNMEGVMSLAAVALVAKNNTIPTRQVAYSNVTTTTNGPIAEAAVTSSTLKQFYSKPTEATKPKEKRSYKYADLGEDYEDLDPYSDQQQQSSAAARASAFSLANSQQRRRPKPKTRYVYVPDETFYLVPEEVEYYEPRKVKTKSYVRAQTSVDSFKENDSDDVGDYIHTDKYGDYIVPHQRDESMNSRAHASNDHDI